MLRAMQIDALTIRNDAAFAGWWWRSPIFGVRNG